MKILVLSLYYEPDRCQSNGPIIRALCEDWAAADAKIVRKIAKGRSRLPSVETPDEVLYDASRL
ncbi:MAG: hypothetical protein EBZ36_15080, partial [Acidobacteria bacterium]|nr:hypothetical protein [Acidobacteriota bacterium]